MQKRTVIVLSVSSMLWTVSIVAPEARACCIPPEADLQSAHFYYAFYDNRHYVSVDDSIRLDGTDSYDYDGGDPSLQSTSYIKRFDWNFGNGSSYYETPTYHPDDDFDGITEYPYDTPGFYTLTFTVTDNDAGSHEYESCAPDKTSDPCTYPLTVVEAYLNIEDVPDNVEEDLGGYVSLNDDDDDDDGVVDYDDGYNKDGIPDNDDDTNPNEDNLVEISLSVSPSLSTGVMKLELDHTWPTGLRVWSSPTKGNMIIPNGEPSDLCYYKEWPVQSMPTTLYVEAISTTPLRGETLSLSYARGEYPAYIHKDIVTFTVVNIYVVRDSSYSQVLDDWPEDGDQLRSPKYIFGENDPIYVQVTNIGTDPQIAEPAGSIVKVTSETSLLDLPDHVLLALYETGPDTQIFRNPVDDLLYLSDSTSQTTSGDKIKVIDEEVLTFWLEIQPGSDNYVTCKTVMVDRGEFLAVAGSDSGDPDESGEDYFNAAISDAKTKMSNDYGWWENGYMVGKYYASRDAMSSDDRQYEESKETAVDAGCKPDYSCADFLFYSGHGMYGNLDIIIAEPEIEGPPFIVNWLNNHALNPDGGWAWPSDVEFCIFSTCDLLGDSEVPNRHVQLWIDDFFDKGIHAVLATSDEIWYHQMDDDFAEFINRLKSGQTVVNAYKNACKAWTDSRYGILVRESNLNDYVLTPVASAAPLTRDYTTTDTTFYYFYYDGNVEIINPAGSSQATAGPHDYYITKRRIYEAMRFDEEIEIDALVLEGVAPPLSIPNNVRNMLEHRVTKKHSFSGWNNIEDSLMVKHTIQISEGDERNNLASLGLEIPTHYLLNSRGRMMVETYVPNQNGAHTSSESWCEGEGFEFIRYYNGCKIFDDRCRVLIQENRIISYTLIYHPVKKLGSLTVRKPHFRFADGDIKESDLEISLVYRIIGISVVPVWQVKFGSYIFHYDVERASNGR